jgi:hypothetical protein
MRAMLPLTRPAEATGRLMRAATISDWTIFFTAQLGAAATLGGLVFVGLSLNLTKILSFPALPNRALLALGVLLGILVVSSLILIPGQPTQLIGFEILAVGLFSTAVAASIELRTLRSTPLQNQRKYVGNLVFLGLALVPYVVGGALMLAGSLAGLYWVAAAVIVSFIKAVGDAWVLLVEINR